MSKCVNCLNVPGSNVDLCVTCAKFQLAAIRLAFPEDHPARKDGNIAEGVRGIVAELHSLKYEANGQLRANLSNAAIQSILDKAKQYMQERDTLRELLQRAHAVFHGGTETVKLHNEITAALGTQLSGEER